jgi:hypothetical protein
LPADGSSVVGPLIHSVLAAHVGLVGERLGGWIAVVAGLTGSFVAARFNQSLVWRFSTISAPKYNESDDHGSCQNNHQE